MRKEDFKDWTSDRLIDEIINLTEKNLNFEWRIKQLEESDGRWECESKSLRDENKALKQHIKDMEDICEGSCFSDDEPDEKDELIAKLQDQHQQDCIKINQLHVTIDTLADKYSMLRKTVGMD